MDRQTSIDILEAGTGFMQSMTDSIRHFEENGYTANLINRGDHFECHSGAVKIYPGEFVVVELVRFENTSDPDDQAALYAISAPEKNIKGLFIESYGLGHDAFSKQMMEALKNHPH